MTHVGKSAQTALELLETMAKDGHIKIDNAHGAYMAVSVERLSDRFVSVAHYYEQNGDLMADPEMVFWKGPDGKFYPSSFKNDRMGIYQECIEFDSGQPGRFIPKLQNDLAFLSAMWMRNIREQQGI